MRYIVFTVYPSYLEVSALWQQHSWELLFISFQLHPSAQRYFSLVFLWMSCLHTQAPLTWMKLGRAAQSLPTGHPVNGRHAHSSRRGYVREARRQRVRRQIEGGGLAGDMARAALSLPGEPVAPHTSHTPLPVHLHWVTAHGGQLEVCQGRSHWKWRQTQIR